MREEIQRRLSATLVLVVVASTWFGCGRDNTALERAQPSYFPQNGSSGLPDAPGVDEEAAAERFKALRLRVDVSEDLKLSLNGEPRDPQTGELYGTVNNPGGLRAKLDKVFKEREANPDGAGADGIQKTVFISAPESIKYGEVVKVIDAVKQAGASPVGLQVPDLPSEASKPQDKPIVHGPWDWRLPGVRIPMETPVEDQDRPISSNQSVVVSLLKDGEVYLGDKRYEVDLKAIDSPGRRRLMSDLKKEIESPTRNDAEQIVYIKASVDISYGQVVGLIDLIRHPEAGGTTQIGLVADRKKLVDSKVPR